MGYPYNFSSAAFDDYFSVSDAPIAISGVETLLAKHKVQFARTMLSSIETILVAEYGKSAKIKNEMWFAELAAHLDDDVMSAISSLIESKPFSEYVDQIGGLS